MKVVTWALKTKRLPVIKENRNLIFQFIFTVFFIGIGIWFIHHEEPELKQVKSILLSVNASWVILGVAVSIVYLFLHGFMYREAFRSIGCDLSVKSGTLLFLKRNFISVFLPAGGVSSLVFFTKEIEKQNITKTQIHLASSIYGFIGILSVIVVAIPSFIYGLFSKTIGTSEWFALIGIIGLVTILYSSYKSLINKGKAFLLMKRFSPAIELYINDILTNKIKRSRIVYTLIFSVFIEFSGIFHLLIALKAMGLDASLFVAIFGYIVAVVFLVISPFLRGVGPVEVSLIFVLTKFGINTVETIAVTFLYRFFEFWIPLFSGLFMFLSKANKLLLRIFPALLLFILGIINIISGMTPAIGERLALLKNFIPVSVITASNYFVIITGLFLLITSAFMLKGLRNSWYFALILSIVSFIGHLTKAIDYEEASIALISIIVLLSTYKEYYIKTNPKLRIAGLQTALLSILAVLIYGIIGFYYLNKKHFAIDFSLIQSIRYTLQNYFLIGSTNLIPHSAFASHFLWSINISGFLTLTFLIYTLIRPYIIKPQANPDELLKALEIVKNYGNSALDYFKTYNDKLLFLSNSGNSFISYRIAGNFAVVLENPVSSNENEMSCCISEFDVFCRENGLRSIFYRVPEGSLSIYKSLGNKALFVGQEAILDLKNFTLEGGSKKTIRNAINKVKERGYILKIYDSPVKDGVLQKLKSVSDEWLHETKRSEIVFSQGSFSWNELKFQTIITVENPEEKLVAFLNIIPDYTKYEATYDLIRKTKDAPNGIIDFILVELFQYLKEKGYHYVNMGFAPMSGIENAQNFPEQSMKFAYEKIKSFSHYKGLREYKDKFEPAWYNRYMIYKHDYDLIQAPAALNKVIKP